MAIYYSKDSDIQDGHVAFGSGSWTGDPQSRSKALLSFCIDVPTLPWVVLTYKTRDRVPVITCIIYGVLHFDKGIWGLKSRASQVSSLF